jgi:molecular chaperone GrpE
MSGDSTPPDVNDPAPAAPDATAPVAPADSPKDDAEIPVEVEAPAPDWEAKIAALEKEKKDNWDRYLRSAADLENLRKRTKRELEDAKYEAKTKTLKEMLPVVDNLERAIEHVTASAAGGAPVPSNPIVEGVQLVLRQFQTAFERLDVVGVEAQDKPFDPNLHEAISQQESDAPPGTIVQVLQRGYKIGERLLRPALVVVAKPQSKPAE